MMEDEPEPSDREKRAIEAIRRELDREFGDEYESPSHPERAARRETRRPTGLAVGLWILALVALAAGAVVASRMLAPVPYANLRESTAIARMDPQTGSASACLIERESDPGPVSMNFTALPTGRENRPDVTVARTSNPRVHGSKSPCPPSTARIAASSRRSDVSLASTSGRSVARGNSGPSTFMAVANPGREPRHVEAP